ncbi:10706_t:CDS:2 [Funneliformis geosporum]|uniref:Polynucleotide phosphorylase 1 n=1 Tax=Funneliformis geosporum TaxID=1117311 RepID=A0A9W4SA76_9GLOM|nr:10706_t:CDS:2 [Funneliformis geosporum]
MSENIFKKDLPKQKKNRFEFNFQGKEVIFEVDQLASKSDKSILCRYGNTTVLTVLTIKQLTKNVNSFFPLTITFEEKFYAVGRIPNAFTKREGRPSYDAITAARLIDRSLRICFLSPSLPYFHTPLAAVIISQEENNFVCNSSNQKLNNSPLELIVSATEEKIVMLEAGAQEISNEELSKAINFAHQQIQLLIGFFQHIANNLGIKKKGAEKTEELDIKDLTKEYYEKNSQLEEAFIKDGRKENKIRPLEIQIDYLPNVHGSAVFSRGETKVLSIVTIGKISEKQLIDNIFSRSYKYFIHHYNFPPFSVNEIASYRSVSRREIGHGELVEKSFDYLIPQSSIFPYTIRVVSEVLSSDGSSSQASICATSLSLMSAGVPLIRPVAGIALGLFEGQIYTDINGLEDKLGEMDFKIAGTEKGICSIQLDVKNHGISLELLKDCLEKARQARLYLIEEMKKYIFHPRRTLSAQVIKCRRFYVGAEKIGLVIGPRGKTINQLTEKSGATIEVQNDGYILIYHQEEAELEATYQAIQNIIRGSVRINNEETNLTLDFIQKSKQIFQPYLKRLDVVEKSFGGKIEGRGKPEMKFDYLFTKSALDRNYCKAVVKPTIAEVLGGNPNQEINTTNVALQSLCRALTIKEKELGGDNLPPEPNTKICATCNKDISNQETTFNRDKDSEHEKRYFCSAECLTKSYHKKSPNTSNQNQNKGMSTGLKTFSFWGYPAVKITAKW